jgi:hypothetical protein
MIGIRSSKESSGITVPALLIAAAIVAGACLALALAMQGRAVGSPPSLAAGIVSVSAGLSLCGVAQSGYARLFLWVLAAVILATFFLASTL